ncbi:MAG: DUF4367 domain-containing protein [Lachnospiraceae bacterium]|nr:DUF4367 domain-containing protein [Lachnospiraceae bacterium]
MKKREHVEEIKNRYEAAKLECRAKKGMDQFPEDRSDEARRLRIIMEQMKKKGLLDQEEEEKVFGPGGYLEQAEQRAVNSPKIVVIKEKTEKKSVWHRAAKWASVAAIFCVSIVVLTMSSEANREYVKDTVSYYVGDDVVVKSRSDSEQVVRNVPESKMRADIKEKLDIDSPVFQYKPENMKFMQYEIFDDDKMAFVYYSIDEKKVILCLSKGNDGKNNTKIYDGELIDTLEVEDENLNINIFESIDKSTDLKVYSAKWERKSVIYRISGIREKQEFYKILKKMTF